MTYIGKHIFPFYALLFLYWTDISLEDQHR